MSIALYPRGSSVLLGQHDDAIPDRPKAVVLAVMLRGPEYETVSYLCSWWCDGQHKEEWLDAVLVEPVDASDPVMRVEWSPSRTAPPS